MTLLWKMYLAPLICFVVAIFWLGFSAGELMAATRAIIASTILHSGAEYGGMGIGLSVRKKLVERHKGDIGIASTPGEGSTFWFTLPVSQTCEGQSEPVMTFQECPGKAV